LTKMKRRNRISSCHSESESEDPQHPILRGRDREVGIGCSDVDVARFLAYTESTIRERYVKPSAAKVSFSISSRLALQEPQGLARELSNPIQTLSLYHPEANIATKTHGNAVF
jgi:hypothetical protein